MILVHNENNSMFVINSRLMIEYFTGENKKPTTPKYDPLS